MTTNLNEQQLAVPWPSGDNVEPALVRAEFNGWLSREAAQLARFKSLPEGIDEQLAALAELQRVLFDSGWIRLGWPEAAGGLGGSPLLRAVIAEEMTRARYTIPFSFGVIDILVPAVIRFGDPAVTAATVPLVLRGDETWCQGFSEPDAGSDLGSLRTRATPVDGGFSVNGQKVWTSWGHRADRCLLLARTGTPEDAHRGITAFFVDVDQPGISVRELRAMNGESEFAEIYFDDVFVPFERVLGEVGGGWAVTMHILAHERGAAAWQRGTWMLQRLEDLIEAIPGDLKPDEQIGRIYAELYALQLMSRRTLLDLAADRRVGPSTSIDKILLATAEQSLFDAALDLLPQMFTGEDANSNVWRNDYIYSRAASIYGGTAEIQRSIVAEHLLGLPKSS